MRVGTDGQKGRRSRAGKRPSLGPTGQHVDAFILLLLSMGTNHHQGLPDVALSRFCDFWGAREVL